MEINRDPTYAQLRLFGLVWAPLACAFVARAAHRSLGLAVSAPILVVVATLLAFAAVRPAALRPVYVALAYATAPIGFIVSRALLVVVYVAVLSPLAWIVRRTRGEALGLAFDRDARTYWRARQSSPDVERYLRPY